MLRLTAALVIAFMLGGLFAMPFSDSGFAAQDPINCDKAGSAECEEGDNSNSRVRDYRNSDTGGCPDGQRLVRVRKTVDGESVTTFECRKSRRAREARCPEGQQRIRLRDNRNGESSSQYVCRDVESPPDDDEPVPTRSDAAGVEGARDIGDVPGLSMEPPVSGVSCKAKSCECDTNENGPLDCDGIYAQCRAKGATVVECSTVFIGKEMFQICNCEF